MYQCPNCGGRLFFDIQSQQLKCDHCSTQYDPYAISKENDAEESREYDVTVFKCPQCGGEILSTDKMAEIPLGAESAGTLKMFALYPELQEVIP